jgi:nucleoside phosphorylase
MTVDRDTNSATVVVLTALNVEYHAVRGHLSGLNRYDHEAGTSFEVGRLPGDAGEIAIAVTGEGNLAAAVLTERAISVFHPAALLFVGVAGALYAYLDIGDVVVATKVYAYHGASEEDDGSHARPNAWPAPHSLEQRARHVALNSSWRRLITSPRAAAESSFRAGAPRVHFRAVAAGDVVLNSSTAPLTQQLHRNYGDAAAIEMESAGAAHAGHLSESKVITIRGISDKADGAKYAADAAGWQPVAAAHAAAFAIALATEIAKPHARLPRQMTDDTRPDRPDERGEEDVAAGRGLVVMSAEHNQVVHQAAGDQYIIGT